MDLAIDIRNIDNVLVDQYDSADSGTRQRLCRDSAYSANAENGDGTALKHL
ncbi:hypothetical protein D3C71_2230290 [compost metagenome]